MSSYIQVVAFNHKKMGTTKGMCERNVRLGYGLPAKCYDAKEDMEYNKKMGTLHPMSTLPKNVSVPVFVDTSSVNEHIECSDKGTFYSDGRVLVNPMNQKFFGWGEYCAKARVVKTSPKPAPAPAPTPIRVGDSVIVNGRGTGNSKGGGGNTKAFVNKKMKVVKISNGRYGCNQYNISGGITGWWASSQIKKA